MCKLYVVSGPLTKRQVENALYAANHAFRSTERDGFGFMAANAATVARGRYFDPAKYIGYMKHVPSFLCGPTIEENALPSLTTSLICHGRTSTNTKSLENVHPFYYKGTYLAHNGILFWEGSSALEPKPACDSEAFLHWLVSRSPKRIDAWKEAIKDWSGFGAIATYEERKNLLTIARDMANLYIARRANGKGWVFATAMEHLYKVSRHAHIKLDTLAMEFPRHIVQFKAGQIVKDIDWLGFGVRNFASNSYDAEQQARSIYGFHGGAKSCTANQPKQSFPDYDKEGQ